MFHITNPNQHIMLYNKQLEYFEIYFQLYYGNKGMLWWTCERVMENSISGQHDSGAAPETTPAATTEESPEHCQHL